MKTSPAVAQIDTDDEQRDAGDVGEAHGCNQQWRQLVAHRSPCSDGTRRASGSKRNTAEKMRTISPNSVPSMMTAPTSAPLSIHPRHLG